MREQDLPILEVYAEALHESARAAQSLDAVFDQAQQLGPILRENPALLRFLEKPAIETSAKKQLLKTAFGGRIQPLMLNLALMLTDKYRGGLWLGVLDQFIHRVERERGIFAASVQSAHVLDAQERAQVKARLEAFTGKQLRIEYEENPSLIGGVLFRYGDTLIDHSLRGALQKIRARLEAAPIA
ncbi:MAG TPA: ATP synthase F1 subunit delta [Candidatus Sumerlaeota bacterium]|nr:ATP synthase F1 subunit delta [Candidatus Sumerlaeota bacterium]HPS00683.1 ATP synthase F1 subunit delta [Candidatus Sumerlaeota bacterium]